MRQVVDQFLGANPYELDVHCYETHHVKGNSEEVYSDELPQTTCYRARFFAPNGVWRESRELASYWRNVEPGRLNPGLECTREVVPVLDHGNNPA